MKWFGGRGDKDNKFDTDFSGTKVYDINGLVKGTRGQLHDQIGQISRDYLQINDPMGGAQRLIEMFNLVPNRKLMETSAEVRYLALGDHETKGPILHLLEEAVRQAEAKGSADLATKERFKALHARYVRMVKEVTGDTPEVPQLPQKKATVEPDGDFSGTKVYTIGGIGKGTRGELVDQVGRISREHLDINDPLGGAQQLLDAFSLVPNRELLQRSSEVRDVAFGSEPNPMNGPIQFLLNEAIRRSEPDGMDKPTLKKHERLQQRYVELVESITGYKIPAESIPTPKPLDDRPFPRIFRPQGDVERGGH